MGHGRRVDRAEPGADPPFEPVAAGERADDARDKTPPARPRCSTGRPARPGRDAPDKSPAVIPPSAPPPPRTAFCRVNARPARLQGCRRMPPAEVAVIHQDTLSTPAKAGIHRVQSGERGSYTRRGSSRRHDRSRPSISSAITRAGSISTRDCRFNRVQETVMRMIMTGDVNLMNVTDPAVPFSLVKDEFRAADVVFCNLECCLYRPPSGHSVEHEGFYADPDGGRRGADDGGDSRGRHRQQRQLRRGGNHRVDRPSRRAGDRTHRGRGEPAGGAGSGHPRAERGAVRVSAAQLGLLADQS